MGLLEEFWHHKYWLPPGATWEDMKESADVRYPKPQDLLLCIPGALILIIDCVGFLKPNCNIQHLEDLISLAKQNDLPVKKVETWFRHRRAQDRPRLMKKFCEASWRFIFYFTSFFSALALLYDVSMSAGSVSRCLSLVLQPLLPALGWFYLLELSFYCSLVATLPFDVKRKDFKEQIIHHIATITLIFVSYCANLIRFGMIVMLVHDASDYILELAKMLHYMKWKRVCEAVFVVFAVVFISSRLVIFPLITYYYFVTKFQMFLLSCLINAFLMILQLLHIFCNPEIHSDSCMPAGKGWEKWDYSKKKNKKKNSPRASEGTW
uniref:TLC domain-containing protein n=1 Tax=Cairina moschata TaxID=8855 RepID=A0A8C3BQS1_CAIMO